MSVPRLLKRQSSLAVLVEHERSKAPRECQEQDSNSETENLDEEVSQHGEMSITSEPQVDDDGGDTDVLETSDEESDLPTTVTKAKYLQSKEKITKRRHDKTKISDAEIPSPLRASSRLKSMVRRGQHKPGLLRDLTVEFEFCAGDFLTVRGEGEDFYLCRMLEDVMTSDDLKWFKVAWYNRVSDNLYEVPVLFVFHLMVFIISLSLLLPPWDDK